MTTNPSNPLVAPRIAAPKDSLAGVWLAEDLDLIAQGIRNGSWIDGTLGVVGASLDALALVTDPVGTLLQYGISWLIEHIKPLSEALDWLAGDPAQISAHANTWRNIAKALHGSASTWPTRRLPIWSTGMELPPPLTEPGLPSKGRRSRAWPKPPNSCLWSRRRQAR